MDIKYMGHCKTLNGPEPNPKKHFPVYSEYYHNPDGIRTYIYTFRQLQWFKISVNVTYNMINNAQDNFVHYPQNVEQQIPTLWPIYVLTFVESHATWGMVAAT